MRAPDFTLPTQHDTPITLSDLRGKKVVLYFYPKDMTSGCTKEACDFRDNVMALKRKGAVIVGVSGDSVLMHKKFAEKYGLSFPLVADEKKEIAKKYGVWKKKSLYGKTYMGIERTTFVIDESGIVLYVFPKAKVDGHVREVLEVL